MILADIAYIFFLCYSVVGIIFCATAATHETLELENGE